MCIEPPAKILLIFIPVLFLVYVLNIIFSGGPARIFTGNPSSFWFNKIDDFVSWCL